MKYVLLTLFVVLGACIFSPVQAQIPTALDGLTISVTPENPAPEGTVSFSATSVRIDLNRADIYWYVNGTLSKKGRGEKQFTMTAGKIGSTTRVRAVATSTGGEQVEATIVVRPVIIDLLWQADSYVPPFYKGKELFSFQSEIHFIALPQFTASGGTPINPSGLVYKWTKDGTVQGSLSGYGKQKFTTVGSVISRPIRIEVEVSTLDGTITSKKSLVVDASSPEIIFYENNPLLGVRFERALSGDINLAGDEIKINAYPYFFSTAKKNDMRYNWSMNNTKIPNSQNKSDITLRKPAQTSGKSLVSLKIENSERLLQFAQNSLGVLFTSGTGN